MVAYEFYVDHRSKKPNLIGILPERRKDSSRITRESIMNWGRSVVAHGVGYSGLFFAKVIIDDDAGRVINDDHE